MSSLVSVTKLVCCTRIVRGQREEHEERTARRTPGGEDSHRVDTKKGSIYIKRAIFNKKGSSLVEGASLTKRVVFH